MRKLIAIIMAASLFAVPSVVHASPYAADVTAMMQPPNEWEEDDSEPPRPEGPDISDAIPQTAYVDKGQPAPFEGVLLNPRAAAEVQTFKEQAEERCQIRVDREVETKRAEMQYEVDVLKIKLTAEEQRRLLQKSINDEHIDFLSKELETSQKKSTKRNWNGLYFVGGVVTGVLVILAGAYAIKEIRKTP